MEIHKHSLLSITCILKKSNSIQTLDLLENYLLQLAILTILFQNYLRAKIYWLFSQLYNNFTDCFVLEVTTVSRFRNRICV